MAQKVNYMKKMWIIPVVSLVLLVIWIGVSIGRTAYRTAKRAAFQEASGIMSKEESTTYERLANKYATKTKTAISEEDFDEVITLIKKGPLRQVEDNYNGALHIAAFSSILAGVSLNDEQKKIVRPLMVQFFQEADTPLATKKFAALLVMAEMKDDYLVKEALPYVDSKIPTLREMSRRYLKAVGYEL